MTKLRLPSRKKGTTPSHTPTSTKTRQPLKRTPKPSGPQTRPEPVAPSRRPPAASSRAAVSRPSVEVETVEERPSFSRGSSAVRRMKEERKKQLAASKYHPLIVKAGVTEIIHVLGLMDMFPVLVSGHYIKMQGSLGGYKYCGDPCGWCDFSNYKAFPQAMFPVWSHSKYHIFQMQGNDVQFENCTLDHTGHCEFCDQGNEPVESGLRYLPLSNKWAQGLISLDEESRHLCYSCMANNKRSIVQSAGFYCTACGETCEHYHPEVNDTYACRSCGHVGFPGEYVDCPTCGEDARRLAIADYPIAIKRTGTGTSDTSYNFERLGAPEEFWYSVRCKNDSCDGGEVWVSAHTKEELECPECGDVLVKAGGYDPIDWSAIVAGKIDDYETVRRAMEAFERNPQAAPQSQGRQPTRGKSARGGRPVGKPTTNKPF